MCFKVKNGKIISAEVKSNVLAQSSAQPRREVETAMLMDIDTVGFMLEEKGLSHSEIDSFFEHHGVKGMKWGVRRAAKRTAQADERAIKGHRLGNRHNDRVQSRVNRYSRVASGQGSKLDKARVLLESGPIELARGSQKSAAKRLDRAQKLQKKTIAGKKHVTDVLNRIGGVDIRQLDYSYTKPAQ